MWSRLHKLLATSSIVSQEKLDCSNSELCNEPGYLIDKEDMSNMSKGFDRKMLPVGGDFDRKSGFAIKSLWVS